MSFARFLLIYIGLSSSIAWASQGCLSSLKKVLDDYSNTDELILYRSEADQALDNFDGKISSLQEYVESLKNSYFKVRSSFTKKNINGIPAQGETTKYANELSVKVLVKLGLSENHLKDLKFNERLYNVVKDLSRSESNQLIFEDFINSYLSSTPQNQDKIIEALQKISHFDIETGTYDNTISVSDMSSISRYLKEENTDYLYAINKHINEIANDNKLYKNQYEDLKLTTLAREVVLEFGNRSISPEDQARQLEEILNSTIPLDSQNKLVLDDNGVPSSHTLYLVEKIAFARSRMNYNQVEELDPEIIKSFDDTIKAYANFIDEHFVGDFKILRTMEYKEPTDFAPRGMRGTQSATLDHHMNTRHFMLPVGVGHDNWWMTNEMIEAKNGNFVITAKNSQSPLKSMYGDGATRVISWPKTFGRNVLKPGLDQIRMAKNLKDGIEKSAEMFVKIDNQWTPFYFEKIGNRWLPQKLFKGKPYKKQCMNCHFKDGKFSPRPNQITSESQVMKQYGITDKSFIKEWLSY